MAEGFEARHRKACPRLELAFRCCLDAGANDLAAIGAEIDDHRQIGGGQLRKLETKRRQAEKDKKQLDEERRIADEFDVTADDGP